MFFSNLLEGIVTRMLSKSRQARYQAVTDVLASLREATGAPGAVVTSLGATSGGEDGSLGSPALQQEIRFCTTEDAVTIAYACVGRGQPLVRSLG